MKNPSKVPVLFITYNRLEYTKQALLSLLNSDDVIVFVFDNNSTDGTKEWLRALSNTYKFNLHYNKENVGISGAMNVFFEFTKGFKYIAKVDNDTIVPKDWVKKLKLHLDSGLVDIVQAKHHLIKAVHWGGFDAWVKDKLQIGEVVFNNFVGGSGIMIRNSIVQKLPSSDWVLGGWVDWQLKHPEIKKGFCLDVFIELLDTDENGEKYSDYPNYYKETKRR